MVRLSNLSLPLDPSCVAEINLVFGPWLPICGPHFPLVYQDPRKLSLSPEPLLDTPFATLARRSCSHYPGRARDGCPLSSARPRAIRVSSPLTFRPARFQVQPDSLHLPPASLVVSPPPTALRPGPHSSHKTPGAPHTAAPPPGGPGLSMTGSGEAASAPPHPPLPECGLVWPSGRATTRSDPAIPSPLASFIRPHPEEPLNAVRPRQSTLSQWHPIAFWLPRAEVTPSSHSALLTGSGETTPTPPRPPSSGDTGRGPSPAASTPPSRL